MLTGIYVGKLCGLADSFAVASMSTSESKASLRVVVGSMSKASFVVLCLRAQSRAGLSPSTRASQLKLGAVRTALRTVSSKTGLQFAVVSQPTQHSICWMPCVSQPPLRW